MNVWIQILFLALITVVIIASIIVPARRRNKRDRRFPRGVTPEVPQSESAENRKAKPGVPVTNREGPH